jgi:hypothetical protein
VSTQYLVFVSTYALALVVASLVVYTRPGQLIVLRALERLGHEFGVGPWGLLHTFGHEAPSVEGDIAERAAAAESYIASAEEQTLAGARLALWVLIAGCVACGAAAIMIVGVLPQLVMSGVWTYETYVDVAMFVVYGTTAGGLAVGAGLVVWLLRTTMRLNRCDGCAVARDLLAAALEDGVSPDLSGVLRTGSYPRLGRLLSHASA